RAEGPGPRVQGPALEREDEGPRVHRRPRVEEGAAMSLPRLRGPDRHGNMWTEHLKDRVEWAKASVERHEGAKPGERRWLVGITPPSYEDEEYVVSLFVREGSPPK